jgi:hypothetical protein
MAKKGRVSIVIIDASEAVEREQCGEKVVVGTFEAVLKKYNSGKPTLLDFQIGALDELRSGNCEAALSCE